MCDAINLKPFEGKFGSSVFEYIDYDPNVHGLRVFRTDEINNIVDQINKNESILFENHMKWLIKEFNEVYQNIYNIYEKTVSKELTSLNHEHGKWFEDDFNNYILTMNAIDQERFELTDLINQYKQLKLVIERLQHMRPILQHVKPSEVNSFNMLNYLKWMHEHAV